MSREAPAENSMLARAFDQSMKLYSLAAMTAGVSVLALAQPAAGEVIVTKKTIPIPISVDGNGPTVKISLTNNGVNDFSFSLYSFNYHGIDRELRIRPLEGGAVVAPSRFVLPLVRGAKIGPSAQFNASFSDLVERSVVSSGNGSSYIKTFQGHWGRNPSNRYVGVRFLINGETHYGWARLTVTTAPHKALSATITAYAYETIANKKIQAGVSENNSANEAQARTQVGTPTLGMLALGAEGIEIWRREESISD